jgi:hemoglobin
MNMPFTRPGTEPPEESVEREHEQGAERSAYAALGGARAVHSLVDDFYRRVLGDDRLAPFFDGVDLARLKRHQVLVIGEVLGGTGGYQGVGLQAGHAGLQIAPSDYARVGEHLVAAFRDAGASDAVVGAVTTTLATVQPLIVTAVDRPEGPAATGATG